MKSNPLTGHMFVLAEEDTQPVLVGSWDPPGKPKPDRVDVAHITTDRQVAERWRRLLADGHLPPSEAPTPERVWGEALSSAAVAYSED